MAIKIGERGKIKNLNKINKFFKLLNLKTKKKMLKLKCSSIK